MNLDTSWWATKEAQASREAFDRVRQREQSRMSATVGVKRTIYADHYEAIMVKRRAATVRELL